LTGRGYGAIDFGPDFGNPVKGRGEGRAGGTLEKNRFFRARRGTAVGPKASAQTLGESARVETPGGVGRGGNESWSGGGGDCKTNWDWGTPTGAGGRGGGITWDNRGLRRKKKLEGSGGKKFSRWGTAIRASWRLPRSTKVEGLSPTDGTGGTSWETIPVTSVGRTRVDCGGLRWLTTVGGTRKQLGGLGGGAIFFRHYKTGGAVGKGICGAWAAVEGRWMGKRRG